MIRCVFPLSSLLQLFLIHLLLILSVVFLLFSWLPYFSPKLFSSFFIRLLVCLCIISHHLSVEFPLVVLECPVLSEYFALSQYLFIFLLSAILFVLFPQVVLLFFLVLPFPFCPYMFKHFPLFYYISLFSQILLPAFPVEFPIQVSIFS